MIKTESLIPYAMNSRTHSPEQVVQIAASIKEFGFTNPVLTDGDNGIIAGHGRVMAAQKLGLELVPCIELPYLTEAQRKAYIIADNKLALNAGWDYSALRVEIEELQGMGFDINLLGFDPSELAFDEPDYSLLGDEDDEMAAGVKKAIQIEFDSEHYDEAKELVHWWRQKGAYIGYMIMTFLKNEQQKELGE